MPLLEVLDTPDIIFSPISSTVSAAGDVYLNVVHLGETPRASGTSHICHLVVMPPLQPNDVYAYNRIGT